MKVETGQMVRNVCFLARKNWHDGGRAPPPCHSGRLIGFITVMESAVNESEVIHLHVMNIHEYSLYIFHQNQLRGHSLLLVTTPKSMKNYALTPLSSITRL